ncbi:hypothetical protein [Ochrovirga pacifica]|uniref:hypothetical protein n=1 Tax=Ochrovirga pacifica TaxID=1042376 RepID=UPI000255A55A|nr:hypothetical protein [Ochrovirga pacifica]
MILIADGGSTKVDWVAVDKYKTEFFKTRTKGLNPAIVDSNCIKQRILENCNLEEAKNKVHKIFFYGAGCGTIKAKHKLIKTFEEIFTNAIIVVEEDMLAAVYAASYEKPAIVCILGTGSNSCYFDGKGIKSNAISLGWAIMDEASGNYFGKKLIRDYFYEIMPVKIRNKFKVVYNLDSDYVKEQLYKGLNPNAYLANHAAFMYEFKNEEYIISLMEEGVEEFFRYRVLPYGKGKETPVYFIGSIAYYFSDIISRVSQKHNLYFAGAIQRPIDKMLNYHIDNLI